MTTEIDVRLATLQDCAAICDIHKSDVSHWQRYDSAGNAQTVRYADLTVYERYTHGGAWMSLETCAIHLNRLLAGSGIPLVATFDGAVLAEAEVYENFEAVPYNHHLSIGVLYTRQDNLNRGLGSALLAYIEQMARLMHCKAVTVDNPESPDFYTGQRFRAVGGARRVKFPTQAGRAFYQASELIDPNPDQIRGWHVALGRGSASRQEWQALFPAIWAAGIPELINMPSAHLKISAAGQNAILYLKEADYPDSQPRECSAVCWSSRPLSAPLLTAIRDRAHREGFDTVVTLAADTDWPLLLAADAVQTDDHQEHYELTW